jgi:prepilin-type processing-associated H-X9-DG protein
MRKASATLILADTIRGAGSSDASIGGPFCFFSTTSFYESGTAGPYLAHSSRMSGAYADGHVEQSSEDELESSPMMVKKVFDSQMLPCP